MSPRTALRDATYETCEPMVVLREGEVAKPLRIVDGDTVHLAILRDGVPVRVTARIWGIDAPELRSNNAAERKAAEGARAHLQKMIEGRLVTAVNTRQGRDKFGRCLCDLLVEGEQTVGESMLASGHSKPYTGGRKAAFADE